MRADSVVDIHRIGAVLTEILFTARHGVDEEEVIINDYDEVSSRCIRGNIFIYRPLGPIAQD